MPNKKQEIPDPKMYYTMVISLVWFLIGASTFICLIIGGEKKLVNEYPLVFGGYVFILVSLCVALVRFSNNKALESSPSKSDRPNPPTSS